VPGVDIGAAVRAALAAGILVKGGGHAMAAGLTILEPRLGELRAFFEERLSETCAMLRENHVLKVDGALTARGATAELVDLLEKAGPYGAGHPSPLFAFPAV